MRNYYYITIIIKLNFKKVLVSLETILLSIKEKNEIITGLTDACVSIL